MRVSEKIAPVLAALGSVGSLACCLPFGFMAALGSAGAAVILASLRPWLLGASVILLVAGFLQLYRKGRSCVRRSAASVVIFWTAASIVLLTILFPQVAASWLAG